MSSRADCILLASAAWLISERRSSSRVTIDHSFMLYVIGLLVRLPLLLLLLPVLLIKPALVIAVFPVSRIAVTHRACFASLVIRHATSAHHAICHCSPPDV